MAHKTIRVPSYFHKFNCIGGKCEDSCCIGWQIPIDETTYKKYKKVKSAAIKKRLDKELVIKKNGSSPDHVAKIKLKNNKCAFLSTQGWCDIYSELGELYLSQTCTLYPRTINQIGQTLECSLTFSCPEALRCMLLEKEPMTFEQMDLPVTYRTMSATIPIEAKHPKRWQDFLELMRQMLIEILQYRAYGFEKRMRILEVFLRSLDELIKTQSIHKIPQFISDFKSKMQSDKIVVGVCENSLLSQEGIRLMKEIDELTLVHKIKSTRYLEVLEMVRESIQNNESYYEMGYTKYYKPFVVENPHMLENYFVNYIIERCAPIDGQMPLESLEKIVGYEKLIRLHLIGIGLKYGTISIENTVLCIQSLAKTFDHHEVYHNLLHKKCSNR